MKTLLLLGVLGLKAILVLFMIRFLAGSVQLIFTLLTPETVVTLQSMVSGSPTIVTCVGVDEINEIIEMGAMYKNTTQYTLMYTCVHMHHNNNSMTRENNGNFEQRSFLSNSSC